MEGVLFISISSIAVLFLSYLYIVFYFNTFFNIHVQIYLQVQDTYIHRSHVCDVLFLSSLKIISLVRSCLSVYDYTPYLLKCDNPCPIFIAHRFMTY